MPSGAATCGRSPDVPAETGISSPRTNKRSSWKEPAGMLAAPRWFCPLWQDSLACLHRVVPHSAIRRNTFAHGPEIATLDYQGRFDRNRGRVGPVHSGPALAYLKEESSNSIGDVAILHSHAHFNRTARCLG